MQHTSRADEATIASTPQLRLKVVRYREYRPFSIIGYSYTVQCATKATRNSAGAHGYQDRGWLTLTSGLDSQSESARAIADKLRSEFKIVNADVLVWSVHGAPSISVDGCLTFRRWSPASVELQLIDPAPVWPRDQEPAPLESKPFFCAEPKTDCRRYEFGGNRRPHYEHLLVRPDGTVSFDVTSLAFTAGTLHVESSDWGGTWHYAPFAH